MSQIMCKKSIQLTAISLFIAVASITAQSHAGQMNFRDISDSQFETNNNKTYLKVEPDSKIQNLIDQSVEKLFKTKFNSDLCHKFSNSFEIMMQLGVSHSSAERITHNCPSLKSTSARTRIHPYKKTYFTSESAPEDIFTSWTTANNKTILFISPSTTNSEIERMIWHEAFISIDPKSGMLLSDFNNPDSTIVNPDEQSPLKRAFNISLNKIITLVFSSLRALEFEYAALNQSNIKVLNKEKCTEAFTYLFKIYSDNYSDIKRSDGKSQIGGVSYDVSEILILSPSEQNINYIMDPNLILTYQGKPLTFCEYMTQPDLSLKLKYSFYSNGPRPKGNGWHGPLDVFERNNEVYK